MLTERHWSARYVLTDAVGFPVETAESCQFSFRRMDPIGPIKVEDWGEDSGMLRTGIIRTGGPRSLVDSRGWMWQAGVFFDLQDGLLDALDVADFVNAQLLQIAPFQCEQFRAADVVPDKVVTVFFQLERLQPGGYFVVAPQMHVLAQIHRIVGTSASTSASTRASHSTLQRSQIGMTMALTGRTWPWFGTTEFQSEQATTTTTTTPTTSATSSAATTTRFDCSTFLLRHLEIKPWQKNQTGVSRLVPVVLSSQVIVRKRLNKATCKDWGAARRKSLIAI